MEAGRALATPAPARGSNTPPLVLCHSSKFLPFEKGREYARSLNLGTSSQWSKEKRPPDVPSNPHIFYKDEGWDGWPDWLGYDWKAPEFDSFEEAREYARSLNLGPREEWMQWCRERKRPPNSPSDPRRTYKDKGWVSWKNWLGNEFLPFQEGREYARSQNLGGELEWKQWCGEGKRPPDIPSTPRRIYKDKGWVSWPDWLGYASNQGRDTRFVFYAQVDVPPSFCLYGIIIHSADMYGV